MNAITNKQEGYAQDIVDSWTQDFLSDHIYLTSPIKVKESNK